MRYFTLEDIIFFSGFRWLYAWSQWMYFIYVFCVCELWTMVGWWFCNNDGYTQPNWMDSINFNVYDNGMTSYVWLCDILLLIIMCVHIHSCVCVCGWFCLFVTLTIAYNIWANWHTTVMRILCCLDFILVAFVLCLLITSKEDIKISRPNPNHKQLCW